MRSRNDDDGKVKSVENFFRFETNLVNVDHNLHCATIHHIPIQFIYNNILVLCITHTPYFYRLNKTVKRIKIK